MRWAARRRWGTWVVSGLAAGLGALTHCSFTVSPSDYTRGLGGAADGGEGEGAEVGDRDGARATVAHVVVVAGERDALIGGEATNVGVADVWTAPIDVEGTIGPWNVGPSAPFRGPAMASLVTASSLFVVADDTSGVNQFVAVEWLPLPGAGALGTTWGTSFVSVPARSAITRLLLPQAFVSLGGSAVVPDEEGNGVLTRFEDVNLSPFDPVAHTFEAPRLATPLSAPRTNGTVTVAEGFVYVVGGGGPTGTATDEVDVMKVDDLLRPESLDAGAEGASLRFTATTSLVNPSNGAAYRVTDPAVCAGGGAIYVVGGNLPTGPSDVVLMSRIDAATGALGAWTATPKLPGPLVSPACFVGPGAGGGGGGRLYVLGGRGATSRSAAILSARIDEGGKLEEWDTRSNTPMPAPRSKMAVVLY